MFFAFWGLLFLVVVRKERLHYPGKALTLLLLCGVWLSCDFMVWHRSIGLIGPGFSTLLGNFQVFFTTIISYWLFGERIRPSFILAILFGFLGLLLMTGFNFANLSGEIRVGILLGFATALFYSFYILTLKQAMSRSALSGTSAMLIISVSSVIILGGLIQSRGISFAIGNSASWWALVGVGVLGSTIGWSLLSAALRVVPASTAGLTMLLQPALSFFWDVLLFNRPTSWLEYTGILLILAAIYLGTIKNKDSQ